MDFIRGAVKSARFQNKAALKACPKIIAATSENSRPAPEKINSTFRVSTSTLILVARDIAFANATIIASSEADRAEARPDFI
jgi:predicted methyltransferase